MQVNYRIRGPVLTILIFAGLASVCGQMQFPGEPIGTGIRMKAADVIYVLPPVDPFQIESALQSGEEGYLKPFQFALERMVDLSPEYHGGWEIQGDLKVWRVHIISPGALSMGLVFNQYRLEPGIKVFVCTPDMMQIKGAFTSGNNKASGILPVGHLTGEELVIEMQVPVELTGYGVLQIESVSHAFRPWGQMDGSSDCPAGKFACSQACEIDINCAEGEAWQLTKRSVVRIYTTRQYCTGVLVNNSAYDGTPYILTAEHCINKQYYADRTVFQFNYESPTCFGPDGPLDMSISGAELIAAGDSIDFSLVKLSLAPPADYEAYYAGWNRSDFQTTATKTIHHPWGDVKKISSDYQAPSRPVQPGDVPYSDLDDYHYFSFWWIRGWDEGSTEGGSSGCPLFNGDQKIIGILSGGIARCGDSIGYDNEKERVLYNQAFNYDDYYTRMSMSWNYSGEEGSSLKPWLDPANTGVVALGGYQPTGMDPNRYAPAASYFLFPNPVNDELYISDRENREGDILFQLFTLSGALTYSGRLEDGNIKRIDTGKLAEGVYVIHLIGEQSQEVQKFIIVR